MMLLLLLTTFSSAPQDDTPPRPPEIRIPVLACTEATDTALLVVSVACLPEIAVATSPVPVSDTDATLTAELVVNVSCFEVSRVSIFTPFRYNRGVRRLLPQVTLPEHSSEGALTGAENVALLLASPSRSMPAASARRSV